MNIKSISTEDLRHMNHSDGLILQGCGGDLNEWVNGINDMLTEEGILLDNTRFEDCSSFKHDSLTCLLFSFTEDVKLDMGKLAMWRLKTHGQFGGTWVSDYVPNRLGGFLPEEAEQKKPDCALIGTDGNVFNLIGIAARTLRRSGMCEQAKEMAGRVFACGSYEEALGIIGEYVNITSVDECEEEGMVIS